MSFNWRGRRGWFRIWIVVALCWAAFVAYESIKDWRVERHDLATANVSGQAAAIVLVRATPQSLEGCQDGTIARQMREPDTQAFAQAVDDQTRLNAARDALASLQTEDAQSGYIRNGMTSDLEGDRRAALEDSLHREIVDQQNQIRASKQSNRETVLHGQYAVVTSCIRSSDVVRLLGMDVTTAIIPPIALPLVGWLIFRVVSAVAGWIGEGFSDQPPPLKTAPAIGATRRLGRFRFLTLLVVTWLGYLLAAQRADESTILSCLTALGAALPIAFVAWLCIRRAPVEDFRLHSSSIYGCLLATGIVGIGSRYGDARGGADATRAFWGAHESIAGVVVLLSIIGLSALAWANASKRR